jgi:hypothetical protein
VKAKQWIIPGVRMYVDFIGRIRMDVTTQGTDLLTVITRFSTGEVQRTLWWARAARGSAIHACSEERLKLAYPRLCAHGVVCYSGMTGTPCCSLPFSCLADCQVET